jgi:hypothetical protein
LKFAVPGAADIRFQAFVCVAAAQRRVLWSIARGEATMSTATAERTSELTGLFREGYRAIREGHDLSELPYPGNLLPLGDAPEYMRLAMRIWHRSVSKLIDQALNDDLLRQTAEEFPPPIAKQWLVWLVYVTYDTLFLWHRDYLALLFLSCALYEDDAKGIAKELSVVLDRAGARSPKWARLEAAWRGIRAIDKSREEGKPKNKPIAYLRAYVANDARTTAYRYGDERPNDPIRLAGHTRLSAGFIDNPSGYLETPLEYRDDSERVQNRAPEKPREGRYKKEEYRDKTARGDVWDRPALNKGSDGGFMVHKPLSPGVLAIFTRSSPDVVTLKKERQVEAKRTLKMISECFQLGDEELIHLVSDGIPAAEAERDLGMPAGAWRNLVKRIHRQFQKRPK